MAFLVVAGITVPVAPTGASEKAPELIGGAERAFDGTMRTTVRSAKRVFQFTSRHITNAAAGTLRALDGTIGDCSGDALGGTISCLIEIGDSPFQVVKGGFTRTVAITLRQA